MIQRLLVSLILGSCFVAAMLTSTSPARAQSGGPTPTDPRSTPAPGLSDRPGVPQPRDAPEVPESRLDPSTPEPLGPLRERFRMRARAQLDQARQRLTSAESDRAEADSRRREALALVTLSRRKASELRRHAARAAKRATTAEDDMIAERRRALEEVQARRAAYDTELLDWFGNRAGAFALAVWLLFVAFLAASWRPIVAWLAFRRARGLDRAGYAKSVAVAAPTVAVGAAAVLGSLGKLNVLAPLVIAAMVILLGVAAWLSGFVRAGSGEPLLTSRRLVPGMATGVMLLTGLFVGLVGLLQEEPAEPRVAPKTAAMARLAEPDPTVNPTKRVARLHRRAERADSRRRRAEARVHRLNGMLRVLESQVRAADRRVFEAKPAVARAQGQVDDAP